MVQAAVFSTLALLMSLAKLSFPEQTSMGATYQPNILDTLGDRFHRCTTGCLVCSKWNGCIVCTHNYTWHLEQVFMRKVGVCLRECPPGYFRRPFTGAADYYRCTSCEVNNCQLCSDSMYCETCNRPYLEYRGECRLNCPVGLYHSQYERDCLEKVDCLVDSWAPWTRCSRAGSVGLQRLQRRNELRQRRCRLLEKTGRPCRRSKNYIGNMKSMASSVMEAERLNTNSPSYYNYYKQSAELLQLLNLNKSRRVYRKLKGEHRSHYKPG